MATAAGANARIQAIAALTQHKAWKALAHHYEKVRELHLRDLFAEDPRRGEQMTAEALGLLLDYSKNRATQETLRLLVELADEIERHREPGVGEVRGVQPPLRPRRRAGLGRGGGQRRHLRP